MPNPSHFAAAFYGASTRWTGSLLMENAQSPISAPTGLILVQKGWMPLHLIGRKRKSGCFLLPISEDNFIPSTVKRSTKPGPQHRSRHIQWPVIGPGSPADPQ